MKYIWLIGLVLLAGCETKVSVSPAPAVAVKQKELTGAEKVGLLRAEAKRRNLNWNIFCIPNTDGTVDYYQADAWEKGTVSYGDKKYYEEGVRDWWAVEGVGGDQNPEDAAYALYQMIQSAPNMRVESKPIKKGDCDYQTVLDSTREGNTPCKKGL